MPSVTGGSSRVRRIASVMLVTAIWFTLPTQAQTNSYVIRSGDVRVTCPLTIGGSFEARTRMINGSLRPGESSVEAWSGDLTVPLGDLDTGIGLRNQHLRDNYLEVGKGPGFSHAVLADVRPTGLAADAPVGKGTFTATLRLHGVERPVTGQVEVRQAGQALRVRASFPVVLEQFGIAKPRYLGVGVREEVTVQVSFDTSMESR
jgi:polyisoprenoid-binding protein YceI